MKKSTLVSCIMLLAAAMMLSGCIFPYWGDDEGGRGRGGGYHEGHGGEGRHEGGDRH